jgi:hypothetical protein
MKPQDQFNLSPPSITASRNAPASRLRNAKDTGCRAAGKSASEDLPGAARGINRSRRGFPPPAYKCPQICYGPRAPNSFNRAPGRNVMAKGQMRSNKEKKKPKADKNLKKGGAAPVNPFATGKTPAGQSPNSKK